MLEYQPEGSSRWITASTEPIQDQRFVVKNLLDDVSYRFRVAAQNKAGVGKYSEISAPAKITAPTGTRINYLFSFKFQFFLFQWLMAYIQYQLIY